MNFEIAIPSYNRFEILKNKTLKLLQSYHINIDKIKIFVKNEEQRDMYIESIGTDYHFILTGCEGIMETRNFLRTYYREQQETDFVLYMDDDITRFQKMCENVDSFVDTVNNMFSKMKEIGLYLGAPSAYNNKFYMNDKITTSLKYCIGAFQLEIIDREREEIHCDLGHFEDFQFSMEYFLRDGGIVRFNEYNIVTKYFELEGGICGQLGGMEPRQLEMTENAEYLVNRYPNMCSKKLKRWGMDLRLNFRYKL